MMVKYTTLCLALLAPLSVHAATDQETTQELAEMRAQIKQLQQQAADAKLTAHPHTASGLGSSARTTSGEGAYNPAISLILSGTYSQLDQDPAIPVTGFAMSGNDTGYTQGFSLKESELGIAANIDSQFRGVATIALDADVMSIISPNMMPTKPSSCSLSRGASALELLRTHKKGF